MHASSSIANNFRRYLLGTLPTADDLVMTGSRLPTKKQILLCFMAHRDATTNKREAANNTVDKVQKLYDKARIPTVQRHKMAEEVEKYHKVFESVLKIPIESRSSEKSKERIEEFKQQLNASFKFWPRNALMKITNEEDKLFLKSMMSDRKACMAGADKKLANTEKKVRKRKVQELQRKEQCQIAETSGSMTCQLEDSQQILQRMKVKFIHLILLQCHIKGA